MLDSRVEIAIFRFTNLLCPIVRNCRTFTAYFLPGRRLFTTVLPRRFTDTTFLAISPPWATSSCRACHRQCSRPSRSHGIRRPPPSASSHGLFPTRGS